MKARTAQALNSAMLLGLVLLFAPEGVFAAEEGGGNWGPWFTIGRFFNLALVTAVLVWVGRKPLASFFAARTQSIRDQLEEAQRARVEAEAKLAEMESRMSRLDEELGEMKASAEREAQDEYRRVLTAAENEAKKILERARQEIEGMSRAARMELKAHIAELSVQLAEAKIRHEIKGDDHGRLFARFVEGLRDRI